jgi:hypothetical protein
MERYYHDSGPCSFAFRLVALPTFTAPHPSHYKSSESGVQLTIRVASMPRNSGESPTEASDTRECFNGLFQADLSKLNLCGTYREDTSFRADTSESVLPLNPQITFVVLSELFYYPSLSSSLIHSFPQDAWKTPVFILGSFSHFAAFYTRELRFIRFTALSISML